MIKLLSALILILTFSDHAFAEDDNIKVSCDSNTTIYMTDISLKNLIKKHIEAGYGNTLTSTVTSNGHGTYGATVCVASTKLELNCK